MTPTHILAAAIALLLTAAPSAAQQSLRGSVQDGAQQPVEGVVVVLHSVSRAGGSELARDTTDADGGFTLPIPDDATGVLFAATRIADGLFVGETFRGEPPADYVLRAGPGVAPFPMPPTGGAQAGPSPSSTAARSPGLEVVWVIMIALALVGATLVLIQRARRRPPAARELMLRIARLDQQTSGAEGDAVNRDASGRQKQQREELLRQLEETTRADARV